MSKKESLSLTSSYYKQGQYITGHENPRQPPRADEAPIFCADASADPG